MTPKPLDVLKKGLSKITQGFKVCRDELNAKLAHKESISSSDEYWLNHEANTVDKQRVIDTLEATSDYKRGVKRLDGPGKAIVMKLRELAGDLAKVAGKKRIRTFFWGIFFIGVTSHIFGRLRTREGNESA